MAKFEYRINGAGAWIEADEALPFNVPGTTWADSVDTRAIGDTVTLAATTIRIAPIDAFRSYAIAPHNQFGAVAWEFVYGNGDNPADQNPTASVGAPFGGDRLAGVRTLPSVASDPETEYTEIIYSGIGSQGIAINVALAGGGTLYFGDYHAGKEDSVQTGTSLRIAAMVALFEMLEVYNSSLPADAQNPDGRTANVRSTIRVNPDASLTNINNVVANFDTLTAALSLLMVGPGFTRASIDLGETWTDISANGSYAPVDVDEVWFRNPTTGTIVKAVDDARAASNFEEKYWDRNSDRVKLRSRFDTVGTGTPESEWFGDQTCVVTYSLAASEPDPVPAWEPYTIDFTQADPGNANLPLGFTRSGANTAPATLTTSGGGSFEVGSGSGVNRWTVTKPEWVLPPGEYTMEVDYTTFTAASAGGSKVASSNSGSSVDAYSAQQSFNSLAPATHIHTFTVPPGGQGFPALEGTTSVDRGWTVSEIRVNGTPD